MSKGKGKHLRAPENEPGTFVKPWKNPFKNEGVVEVGRYYYSEREGRVILSAPRIPPSPLLSWCVGDFASYRISHVYIQSAYTSICTSSKERE